MVGFTRRRPGNCEVAFPYLLQCGRDVVQFACAHPEFQPVHQVERGVDGIDDEEGGLGEVVFGGLGTGLSSTLMIAGVAVFLGGLMIGRTPEYVGKRITAAETRLTALYALLKPVVVLLLTAVAIATNAGRAGLVTNSGPRGFTEAQGRRPTTAATLPSDSAAFGALVRGTILLVGALCFLPALAPGPIARRYGTGAGGSSADLTRKQSVGRIDGNHLTAPEGCARARLRSIVIS